MNNVNAAKNINPANAPRACALCEGVLTHECWCSVRDPGASYAYQIVVDPSKMTMGDSLILHSLGVAWADSVPVSL